MKSQHCAKIQPGVRVTWETVGGLEHSGVVLEVEEGVAVVECDDGVKRAVEVDER